MTDGEREQRASVCVRHTYPQQSLIVQHSVAALRISAHTETRMHARNADDVRRQEEPVQSRSPVPRFIPSLARLLVVRTCIC